MSMLLALPSSPTALDQETASLIAQLALEDLDEAADDLGDQQLAFDLQAEVLETMLRDFGITPTRRARTQQEPTTSTANTVAQPAASTSARAAMSGAPTPEPEDDAGSAHGDAPTLVQYGASAGSSGSAPIGLIAEASAVAVISPVLSPFSSSYSSSASSSASASTARNEGTLSSSNLLPEAQPEAPGQRSLRFVFMEGFEDLVPVYQYATTDAPADDASDLEYDESDAGHAAATDNLGSDHSLDLAEEVITPELEFSPPSSHGQQSSLEPDSPLSAEQVARRGKLVVESLIQAMDVAEEAVTRAERTLDLAEQFEREEHPTRNTCEGCYDLTNSTDCVGGPCGHHFCSECLSTLVSSALMDESLFPLRCCEHALSLNAVEQLLPAHLSLNFRRNKRICRCSRRSSVLCNGALLCFPRLGRGDRCWRNAFRSLTCTACGIRTCAARCRQGPRRADCVAQATSLFDTLVKENQWQRCPSCGATGGSYVWLPAYAVQMRSGVLLLVRWCLCRGTCLCTEADQTAAEV
ncbi:hypothetical protein BD626DRAFT_525128 [Schizophyllum amplum]|uniref:RING-type domain-containing protein n=1 Tax=Schizophyllum amplum TaxID=97359 RepID=A0A550BSM9_9AGAR|nr:hypothetical protein BD626DRAFT_525128 [Auriculariopsis ampla]